jgi:hypothetical protein
MGKWKLMIFSIPLMPVIFSLNQMDRRTITLFRESTMITGLSGTAWKPGDKIQAED